MQRDDRSSNLMFLFSLPLLATACPTGEGEESTTNNTSVSPTTDPDTGHAGTSTSNGSAETSTSNGSVETSSTGEPGTSVGTVDTGYTTGYTTGGNYCTELPPLMGPVGQACIDYTAKTNECYFEGMLTPECIMQYEAYCQYAIESGTTSYGEACGMAQEEWFACLSMLTCEELGDMTPDCPEQSMALDMACAPA